MALLFRFIWLSDLGHVFLWNALALPVAFLKHIDVGFLTTVVEIVAVFLDSPGLGLAGRGYW